MATPSFRRFSKAASLLLLGMGVAFSGLSGCASDPSKDGLTALDTTPGQSANYGTTDKNRERDADNSKVDLLKYKHSF